PALRAGGGELRGGWGRALHLPALPRVAVEGAAHDERARAHQRRVSPPHQDAGAVAHRGRRPFAPLRSPAQRAHQAPTARRLARDPELGPDRQQGSVASSEENNDSSTVPDDALRSFPPLDRHRREAKQRLVPALAPGNVDQTLQAPVAAIVAQDIEFYERLPELF